MSTKKIASSEALAVLRQEIRQRTEIVRIISALQEQIAFDRTCGAWLSTENNLSAVIRRISADSYRMLLFDNSLCYRRIVQDAMIVPVQHTLQFGNADDPHDVNIVGYDAANETLTLGCYGKFVAEDAIRRQGDDCIIAEENPYFEEEA